MNYQLQILRTFYRTELLQDIPEMNFQQSFYAVRMESYKEFVKQVQIYWIIAIDLLIYWIIPERKLVSYKIKFLSWQRKCAGKIEKTSMLWDQYLKNQTEANSLLNTI